MQRYQIFHSKFSKRYLLDWSWRRKVGGSLRDEQHFRWLDCKFLFSFIQILNNFCWASIKVNVYFYKFDNFLFNSFLIAKLSKPLNYANIFRFFTIGMTDQSILIEVGNYMKMALVSSMENSGWVSIILLKTKILQV